MDKPLFLYHGSSNCLTTIEPRQAYDWGYEQGSQLAVYATSSKDMAICFALGSIKDENNECHRIMDPRFGEPLRMVFWKGTPNFGGKGYIYKVRSDEFTYAGGTQWVCKSSVIPCEIEEIEVNNYLHMFRYATDEEKRTLEQEYENIRNLTN